MRGVLRSIVLGCALGLLACKAKIPDGVFACKADKDCPSGQFCHSSDKLCHAKKEAPSDAGDRELDAANDASSDANDGSHSSTGGTGGSTEAGQGTGGGGGTSGGTGGASEGTGGSGEGTGGSGATSDTDGGGEPPTFSDCNAAPDESAGIFVSLAGSSALDCGSPGHACATIMQGIARAQSTGVGLVYIDTGSYPESVTLPAGITLRGGWNNVGGNWKRQCKSDRDASVMIASPTNIGVDASYDGSSGLDTLTIDTKSTAAAGESMYGVFAHGTKTVLSLNDVIVVAAAGGDGAQGAAGMLAAGTTGTCPSGDGAAGPDGMIGAGAVPGSFGAGGYTASDGSIGMTGMQGDNGTMAGAGSCVSCTDGTTCSGNILTGPCAFSNVTGSSCGGAGSSGCGGAPSPGGQGGHGGGVSIALFVWDAKVTTDAGTLEAGNGGQGGLGGDSAAGGAGTPGVAGSNGPSCNGCFLVGGTCTGMVCQLAHCANTTGSGTGSTGGTGGTGGKGGAGGGGAGGFSYAVYKGGAASVTIDATTMLMHGSAGMSMSNGSVGDAADVAP